MIPARFLYVIHFWGKTLNEIWVPILLLFSALLFPYGFSNGDRAFSRNSYYVTALSSTTGFPFLTNKEYQLRVSVVSYIHFLKQVRLNYASTHQDPPPSTTTHHQPKYTHRHPPPPTTSQNISTTIHHHPPPPTTSQNISTTTHHQPKYIHHHSPPPTDNFFIRNPFIRISSHCLTAT